MNVLTDYVSNLVSGLALAQGPTLHTDTTAITFLTEIVLMVVVGRLLGELMLRIRQPEVLGQLLAGILIGPTVLGNVWPAAHHLIFPDTPELKKMLDAVSQLGILMLLLLAGMEIDFAIVRRRKRTAFFSSVSGIVVPFACGMAFGALLPESMLPSPDKRLVTTLFLATALSISSVKIVAMVIMEMDFLRRNLGQLILGSAIIDDTVGWIIVAFISGLAAEGALDLRAVALTVTATVIFLAVSFTFGRTLITHLIRWTNDALQMEFSVLSVILMLMCLMAVLTDLIGVHTVLGAFVCGILAGQSPMMTDHIREQLRGLVVALFAPIFFAVAGLSVDLTILAQGRKLALAIGLILIASVGKLAGCFGGGRLGGLSTRESLAMAIGMNARGTTEVIVATIGLSIGVLSRDFYTLIVVMAVTTTLIMPPMLRWALGRIPVSREEHERLEREKAEAKDFLPHIERLLLVSDEGDSGKLAALLGGLLVGTRNILATVLEFGDGNGRAGSQGPTNKGLADHVKRAVDIGANEGRKKTATTTDQEEAPPPAQLTVRAADGDPAPAILGEAKNGYDTIFVGLEDGLTLKGRNPGTLTSSIEQVIREFDGALSMAVARNGLISDPSSMNILVATTGTDYSRLAAEVAIAIAKGCNCRITAFNVSPPPPSAPVAVSIHKYFRPGRDLLRDIRELGKREGVAVKTRVKVSRAAESAILSQVKKGKHNLLVIGANVRQGEELFLGHIVKTLLEKSPCSMLVVTS